MKITHRQLRNIVGSALAEAKHRPHELVAVPAGAIIGELEGSFADGQLAGLADDAMYSIAESTADADWVSAARHEDVDGLAEQVVEEVLKSPELREGLRLQASRLVRMLMEPA